MSKIGKKRPFKRSFLIGSNATTPGGSIEGFLLAGLNIEPNSLLIWQERGMSRMSGQIAADFHANEGLRLHQSLFCSTTRKNALLLAWVKMASE
jgi:hypothetical protein